MYTTLVNNGINYHKPPIKWLTGFQPSTVCLLVCAEFLCICVSVRVFSPKLSDWMGSANFLFHSIVWEAVWSGARVLRWVSTEIWTSFLTQSNFFKVESLSRILQFSKVSYVHLKSVAEKKQYMGRLQLHIAISRMHILYGGFLKWWISSTTPWVFLLKMIILGCEMGVPPFQVTSIKIESMAFGRAISEGERSTTTYWTIQQPSSFRAMFWALGVNWAMKKTLVCWVI